MAPTFPTLSIPPTTKLPLGVWQFSPTKKNHFICRCRCQKLQYLIECLYARCAPSATSVPLPSFSPFPHLTFAQFHICKQAFAYVAFCQLSARTENSWHVCHEPRLSEALRRARERKRGERGGERESKQCLLLEIDSMWKICSASATCKLLLRALPLAISSLQMKLPQLSRSQSQIP